MLTKLFNFRTKKVEKTTNLNKSVEDINKIIDEIHETFYTEVDRLLESAKISKSIETVLGELIDKRNRLIAQGFVNTIEVKEANIELVRIQKIKFENDNNVKIIEAIDYFSKKYPLYKFITEDSVKKICKKYNLVYGSVEDYIGDVPNENLKHIENFKVCKEDMLYHRIIYDVFSNSISNASYHNFLDHHAFITSGYTTFIREKFKIAPLEIAAPQKDFDLKDKIIGDFKIDIPDPVVLRPVYYENTKYYLVVTAWGQEAVDPLVQNPLHN